MKINPILFFWMLLFFPFVQPVYFSRIPSVNSLFNYWLVFSFFVILIMRIKFKKMSLPAMLTIFFVLTIVLSTVIAHPSEINRAFSYALTNIGLYLFIDYMLKKDTRLAINVLMTTFELLIYANLLTVIFFPSGLYITIQETGWSSNMSWLLGLRNSIPSWIITGICICMIYYFYTNNKLRSILFISGVFLTLALININFSLYSTSKSTPAGIIVSFVVILIYFLIPSKIKTSGFISLGKAMLMNLIIFIGLVFFRLQSLFSNLIAQQLLKNETLTGRDAMWERALHAISQHPILGYGIEPQLMMAQRLGNIAAVTTTHNTFLDIIYRGGLLSTIIFFILIIVICKKANTHKKDKIAFMISYMIAIYFFTGQTEGFSGSRMFILLAIAANIPLLVNCISEARKNEGIET